MPGAIHAYCLPLLFAATGWLGSFVSGAASVDGPRIPRPDFSDATAYHVVRIERSGGIVVDIDGEETRLRLAGLESRRAGSQGRKSDGPDLQRFLSQLLGGESVFIEFASGGATEDKFGRLPAYVYRADEGLLVNLEVVRQGVARLDKKGKLRNRAVFEHYAKRAKAAGKGVWSRARKVATRSAAKNDRAERRDSEETHDGDESDAKDGSVQLYMTKYGKRYHRADCVKLTDTRRKVTLAQAEKAGRTPCLVCEPPKK